jgi:hypothetical protein
LSAQDNERKLGKGNSLRVPGIALSKPASDGRPGPRLIAKMSYLSLNFLHHKLTVEYGGSAGLKLAFSLSLIVFA